ncbi:MAG: hypothetical protein WC838_03425 [Candidatus Margulisiibacteriota bacterium]|jgi:hypothetical protein
MFKKTLLGISLLAMLTITALAVPNQLTYSGRLLQNGALVNSSLPMTFYIYPSLTGGSAVWTSTADINVEVNQGIYSINLEQITPNVFLGDDRYLEVKVGSETLAPRTKINSVGYALQAGGLSNGGTQAVSVATNGYVGVGTSVPNRLLHVEQNTGGPVALFISDVITTNPVGAYNGGPGLEFMSRKTAVTGDIGWVHFYSYDNAGSGNQYGAMIKGYVGATGAIPTVGLKFQVNDGSTIYADDAMIINPQGNVGIGTTNPNIGGFNTAGTVLTMAAKSSGGATGLELVGNRVSNGAISTQIDFYSNAGATPFSSIYALRGVTDTANGVIVLQPNIGNVGIGTTAPGYSLDVSGDIHAAGWISGGLEPGYRLAYYTTVGAWPHIYYAGRQPNDGTGPFPWNNYGELIFQGSTRTNYNSGFSFVGGTAEVGSTPVPTINLRIDGSGNTVIGTSVLNNPGGWGRILQVSHPSNAALSVRDSNGGKQYEYGVEGNNLYMAYDTIAAQHRMVVDTNGNVGLGTTSPATKLEVYGGRIAVSGNAYGAGSGQVFSAPDGGSTSFVIKNGQLYRMTVKTCQSSTYARLGCYLIYGLNRVVSVPKVLTLATDAEDWTWAFSAAPGINDNTMTITDSTYGNQGLYVILEQLY